jgi:hypothetical protein
MPRFETFERVAIACVYVVYEGQICFCCVVAFPNVLVDTSASQPFRIER